MSMPASVTPASVKDSRTLVLDLDNTLLRADVLYELALAFIRSNPLNVFLLALWLVRGKAHLKGRLAQTVILNVDALPVNEEIVAYAREQKALGRQVVLATATDALIARRIARRFDFIDTVVGTEGGINLKGRAKAERLGELYPGGFVYAGDSRPDLEVWSRSQGAVVVSNSRSLLRKVARLTGVERHVAAANPARAVVKSLRLHQWAKNALVFAPLVLAGMATDLLAWSEALLAFLALSLLASGTYVLNDLSDLQDDRLHWSKRNRPIASGALPIRTAVLLFATLLAASGAIALFTSPAVFVLLLAYGALTVAYSLALKRQPIVDAFVLATLFTLRLGIGMAAVGADASAWLLVFSMFLFGSLSLAKRYTEITRAGEHGRREIAGRGYVAADALLVLAMGVASALGAIVIMVLYLIEDAFGAGFYAEPEFLWAFPAVLFLWVGRIWLLSARGELNDDPVAFAVRDRTSIVMAAVMALAFAGAMTIPL